MISKPLLKNNFLSNKVIIIVFIGILAMYQTTLIFMYSPSMIEQMAEMAKSMGSIGSLKGMDKLTGGFAGFIAQYYFAMIIPMFMLIYNIIIGNKVIAGMVDKGSMACLLSSPNTRNTISITNAMFVILSNVLIIGVNAVIGLICCLAYEEADISIGHFLLMNFGALILIIAISAISFFFSCVFNESKKSLALGGGIPIMFLLFDMLSDMGEKLEVFEKLTIFSLNMPDKIVNKDYAPAIIGIIILAVLSLVLYVAGIKIFKRKDLPI